MNPQLKDLLKPEILHTVNGLELIARIVVEGYMTGSNRSQTVGSGQEFSQYRSYEPGDDLRQLDWKMYARSERYFIKQADIETNITVKFILDASKSMAYSEAGISKLQYAKVLAAALAYLARKQSDTFGLYAVNEKGIRSLQPRFEQQQFMRFLYLLVELETSGEWIIHNLEQLYDHHGKELIIFFSDLYDKEGDLQRFISRLKTPRNEVIVFHLMGSEEKDLSYKSGSYTFEDLESGVRIKADTALQQKQYTDKVNHWIQQSRMWMLEKQISYSLVTMNEPFEDVLRNFLKVRKTLVR